LFEERKRTITDYNLTVAPSFDRPFLIEPARYIQLKDGSLKLQFGIRSSREDFLLKWVHNESEVNLKDTRYQQVIKKISTEQPRYFISLLIKKPMTESDAGKYTCEVHQNEKCVIKTNFNVNLPAPKPTILEEPRIYTEEDALIFDVVYKACGSVVWSDPRGQEIGNSDPTFVVLDGDNSRTQLKIKVAIQFAIKIPYF
jgi:hypothetical protein